MAISVKLVPDFGTGENYREINYSDEQIQFMNDYVGFIRNHPEVSRPRPGHSADVRLSNGQTFTAPHLQEIINYQLNNFKGWLCHAGLESLYVDTRGFVFMANCGVGGKIGNIRDNFEFPTKIWGKDDDFNPF